MKKTLPYKEDIGFGGQKMFDDKKCERCGECLVRCKYVSYDSKKAVLEITALMNSSQLILPKLR